MIYKVGLLLPVSVIYPAINFELMAGLRTGLAERGINDAEIKTENIGTGGNDKQIYAQCEKLLMEGTGIIAGYVNATTAQKLAPLFANANAIFLCLDAGYHFPAIQNKQRNVFYISFQGALCCRIAAKTAFDEGMRKAAFVCSYYEAGYRSAYAYSRCLEEEKGEVTFNHITKLKRAEFTLAPLKEHLQHTQTDVLFASFCGDMLQDFFTACAADSFWAQYPVYGSSFMGEEQWLAPSPYPGMDVKVCVPWGRELANNENKKFIDGIKELRQKANVFSLLGMEAGIVMAQALGGEDADEMIKRLEGYTYQSPRGTVCFNTATHETNASVYEAIVQKDEGTGNCRLEIIKESIHTGDQRQKLYNDIIAGQGQYTSWLNAYTCLDS